MNQHIQEVDAIDRRHRIKVRIASLVGAASLAVFALWSAGVSPGFLIERIYAWFNVDEKDRVVEAVQPIPVVASVKEAAAISQPVPAGTDSSISKTPLPLILSGTEPGRTATEGKAFLGVARDSPQTYAAGAILANGARIKEIHADYIVLERNGKLAKLYVDGSKQNAKALNELLAVGGQPAVKLAVAATREVLTDYIRPSPVYDGQLIKGYQVYAGQRSGVFSQMGLQGGDVILTINDMPFVDPQQAASLFKQLTNGMAIVANIERNGKVQRVHLDGALIVADQERIENPSPPSDMSMAARM